MAVPKRKTSRANTRHRKARWMQRQAPTMGRCNRCHAPVRPHTVCSACGTYRGRQVLEPRE